MDNSITLSFTVGQLFAVVGAVCLIAITIYLVGAIKELKKTLQQVREVAYHVNEVVEDVQATKLVITSKIAELKKFLDISKKWGEMRGKLTRKKKKKD